MLAGALAVLAVGGWWVWSRTCSLNRAPEPAEEAQPPEAPAAEAAEAADATGSLESREARMVALWLSDSQNALRRELDALQKQIGRLSEALAAVRIEADGYKARLDRGGLQQEWRPVGDLDGELRIREVSAELRMVILDGGVRRGLRNGMTLAAMREDRPVARLRVVDARTDVAGAIVEESRAGELPAAGDRVIPAPSEMTLR